MTAGVVAKELIAQWLQLDATDPNLDDARRVIESLGSDVESDAARAAASVRSPLAEVSAHQADGGEVARALADLRREMDALDPSELGERRGWFARAVGKVPGVGTPGARYLQRLESSHPRVNALVESLDRGRGVLLRDNMMLSTDRDRLRELSTSLDGAIANAGEFEDALVFAVDVELAPHDPRRPLFEDDLLAACRRRMGDLGRAHVVNQQTTMAIDAVMDDNRDLIVGLDRIRELTLAALAVASTAGATRASESPTLDGVRVDASRATFDELDAAFAEIEQRRDAASSAAARTVREVTA